MPTNEEPKARVRRESQLAKALGAMIASGDRELAAFAWARIDRMIGITGSILRAARELGISHRSLCRWRASRGGMTEKS
jgi:electron transfer flavoprotein alpha subunit